MYCYCVILYFRYSMGLQSVGMAQCDENKMTALVKLSVSDDNVVSQYNGACDLDLESNFNDLDLGEEDSSNVGVRKRASVKPKDNSHVEDVEMDHIKKKNAKRTYDPLKWFGVLVPPALRQSQVDFKKTTETVVAVANLRTKIDTIQKEYRILLKKKKELQ